MASFNVGDTFSTFEGLEEFIKKFENANSCQLYKRDTRSIEAARKKGIKQKIKEELKYYRIVIACIHGGRVFKTTASDKRPKQKYVHFV
jgi:hypothetical protein